MAALAHNLRVRTREWPVFASTNPVSDAEKFRYAQIASDFAQQAGVHDWEETKFKKRGRVAEAFITELDEKIIKSPAITTPYTLYIFLHEAAHHFYDHVNSEKPYHVEEYEATRKALEILDENHISLPCEITEEAAWNVEQAIEGDRKKKIHIKPEAEKFVAKLKECTAVNPSMKRLFDRHGYMVLDEEGLPVHTGRDLSKTEALEIAKDARKAGEKVHLVESNPAHSPEQYRLAQAVLSGTVRGPSHMSKAVARELVERTPAHLRSEWSTNPFYGDLDVEAGMVPAWVYYDSKEARDHAARLYEGQGKKIIREHSMFGFKEGGGKKWRLRAATHMGNPSKAFGGNIHQQLVSAATQYDMKEEQKAAKRRAAGKQGYHNIYALPQYLGRIEEVEADIAAGAPVRKAIVAAFTGRLQDAMLKAVGEPKGTLDEVRGTGGGWSYSPASKQNPGQYIIRGAGTETNAPDKRSAEKIARSLSKKFGPSYRFEVYGPEGYLGEVHQLNGKIISSPTLKSFARQNPAGAAEEMFESFHGEPSDETVEYVADEHYHSNLSALGELVELKVKLVNGDKAVIGFDAGSGEEKETNPKQKWVIPFRRGKKNYEDVGYLPYALEHDIGFGGDKMYRPVKYENGQITVMSSELSGSHYDRYSRKSAIGAIKHLAQNAGMKVNPVGNPFWPFNSFTKTTIYHVGTGEKYKKSGSFKGYTLYQKLDTGEFLVPALDKESRFDTLKDTKEFVNSWTKHQKNPGGPLDEHAAKELELYVENDADLYRQQYTPINKNLITKMARGVYKHDLAVKLFGYLMESGAKKYAKDYSEGKDWHQIFSPATRKHVAELFAKHFEVEAGLGNYDNLLPKKYQKKNPRRGSGGPFHEAGKLVSGITHGAQRPMDQFLGAAGKVGGYLDSQIGRALNPGDHSDTGPTFLTSNESGTALFLVGGDQSLDLPSLGITGDMASKESIVIGEITNITYHTRKTFDGKPEEFDYTHKAGEVTGDRPILRYDRINCQLFIDGGAYKIKKPKGETSPGIEN